MRQTLFSSFSLFVWLYSLLILAGCSDTPYTGSMLSLGDVDKYIVRPDSATICLQTEVDSRCFRRNADGKGPIIHIYPQKLVYEFYYQDDPILRVQRTTDTTALRQTLSEQETQSPRGDSTFGNGDGGGNNNGNGNGNPNGNTDPNNTDNTDLDNGNGGGNNNGNGNDDGNPNGNTDPNNTDDDDFGDAADLFSGNDGWFIRLYYPEGRNPPRGVRRLEDSRLTIKINGQPIRSADIQGFAHTTGSRGPTVQFFYPNVSGEASQLTVEVTGLVADGETVTFYVDPLTETN